MVIYRVPSHNPVIFGSPVSQVVGPVGAPAVSDADIDLTVVDTPITIGTATAGAGIGTTLTVVDTPVEIPTPTFTSSISTTLTVVPAPVEIPTPTVAVGSTITLTVVPAPVEIPTPSVSTANDANVNLTVVGTPVEIPTPTFTSSVAVSLTVVPAPVEVLTPTAGAGAGTTLTTVPAPVDIPTPTVSTGSTVALTVVPAPVGIPTPVVSAFNVLYPASISGRKLLDQNSGVFLMPTMSSWGMATQLTDAEITTALEEVAANGFKGVTVWIGGGYEIGSAPTGWNKYENADGEDLWSGTPWASSLGPGWSSVDWIAEETGRLGLVFNASFPGAFSTTGAGDDWEGVTNTDMYNAGVAIATRYLDYPHIIWHIMLDSGDTPGNTRGTRIQNLFDGINDTEGSTTRPVRWMEVENGNTTDDQGWFQNGFFNCTVNSIYSYDDDSVVQFETGWAQTTDPTGDCEPPYIGAGHYAPANENQKVRERNYAVFIEGGCLINFGHEDWWTFGADGLFTAGLTFDQVQASAPLVQASYCWALIDQYVRDSTWAPTSGFVTTGEGTTTNKASQGASDNAALAYFPNSRTIVVDTTIIAGTGNVRLRWFDPSDNSFSTIAASEAQNATRSVTHPGNSSNSVGQSDYVLVVEAVGDTTAPATTVTLLISIPTPTFTSAVSISLTVVPTPVSIPTPTFTSSASASATAVEAPTVINTPSVSTGAGVTLTAVDALVVINTPTVTSEVSISLTTVAAPVEVLTPTFSSAASITLSVVEAPTVINTPSVSTGAGVTLTVVDTPIVVNAPSVATGVTISLTTVAAPVEIPTPAVTAGGSANVNLTVVTATVEIPTPSVGAGAGVDLTVVDTPVIVNTPTVTSSVAISLATVPAPVEILTPSVDVGSGADVSLTTLTLTLQIAAATVAAGSTISLATVETPVEIPTPAFSSSVNIQLSTLGLPGGIGPPTGSPNAGTIGAPVVILTPTVTATSAFVLASVMLELLVGSTALRLRGPSVDATVKSGTIGLGLG